MKKIPTLFKREFDNHGGRKLLNEFTPGLEDFPVGYTATVKFDGACCAIMGGELYKRYDAKKGRKPPAAAIPCCEPDPVTGHHPHWVKCDRSDPADKWFWAAWDNTFDEMKIDGTFEAVGPHFSANPYRLEKDILIQHGRLRPMIWAYSDIMDREHDVPRIEPKCGVVRVLKDGNYMEYLGNALCGCAFEGLVFWKDGEPVAKLKLSDYGLPFPVEYTPYEFEDGARLASIHFGISDEKRNAAGYGVVRKIK